MPEINQPFSYFLFVSSVRHCFHAYIVYAAGHYFTDTVGKIFPFYWMMLLKVPWEKRDEARADIGVKSCADFRRFYGVGASRSSFATPYSIKEWDLHATP